MDYFKLIWRHLLNCTEGATKLLSHDSRSMGRVSNPGAPEYEVGVLTTRTRSSMSDVYIYPCSVGKNLKEGGCGL